MITSILVRFLAKHKIPQSELLRGFFVKGGREPEKVKLEISLVTFFKKKVSKKCPKNEIV